MARNGSGVYSLAAGNPVITGTTISSTWANNTLSDIASALTGSIASDGQTVITANLGMSGYAHTGVGSATARTMYSTAGQVQDSTLTYLTTITGTDTLTAVAPVLLSAYATGQVFHFLATGTNTGAVTININGIGAKSIKTQEGADLSAGDLTAGLAVQIIYDGTNFQYSNKGAGSNVGYLNIPQNSQSTNYTLVLSDSGKYIYHPTTDANARTYTIPANSSVAYPIGTALTFINMTAELVTIAITDDTMYLSPGGTTGSRSLAQYGSATAIKLTSTTWLISGSSLT